MLTHGTTKMTQIKHCVTSRELFFFGKMLGMKINLFFNYLTLFHQLTLGHKQSRWSASFMTCVHVSVLLRRAWPLTFESRLADCNMTLSYCLFICVVVIIDIGHKQDSWGEHPRYMIKKCTKPKLKPEHHTQCKSIKKSWPSSYWLRSVCLNRCVFRVAF